MIWAQAKARGDQNPGVATAAESLPGIRRRLSLDGAQLVFAQRAGHAVGFTLFAPRAQTLEIFYLGVSPDSWGSGVGSLLLLSAEDHARAIAREALELWVISNNERAIGVYERSGFIDTKEENLDKSSGTIERRFLRQIG